MYYRRLFSSLPSSLSHPALSLSTSRSFSRPFTHASSLKLSATSPSLARTRGGISHKDPDAPSDAPGLTPPITDGPVDALQEAILQLSRRLTEVLKQSEWGEADEAVAGVVKQFQRVIKNFLKVKADLRELEQTKSALEDPQSILNDGHVPYFPQKRAYYRSFMKSAMVGAGLGNLSQADQDSFIEDMLDHMPEGAIIDQPKKKKDVKAEKEDEPKTDDRSSGADKNNDESKES